MKYRCLCSNVGREREEVAIERTTLLIIPFNHLNTPHWVLVEVPECTTLSQSLAVTEVSDEVSDLRAQLQV